MKAAGSIPACAGEPASCFFCGDLLTVYPRVCGGTRPVPSVPASGAGLSPRVRGNPFRNLRGHRVRRSIPACAGEPGDRSGHRAGGWVYPRVCGGTVSIPWPAMPLWGLSPRVRGNRSTGFSPFSSSGSIPACAGEPPAWPRRRRKIWVYPRVCGGTRRSRAGCPTATGLSPRVRGNLRHHVLDLRPQGSIPACAGEPNTVSLAYDHDKVYPRVCGGTVPLTVAVRVDDGLSPRVRGNPGRAGFGAAYGWSIPACAGEPRKRSASGLLSKVYPRVCGGTAARAPGTDEGKGLSPRVRGNREQRCGGGDCRRSIPACAGEPRRSTPSGPLPRVYPRVCGGTAGKTGSTKPDNGLSPRVRGNHRQRCAQIAELRSIPACAGEPAYLRMSRRPHEVYPRVCGGTATNTRLTAKIAGLSPRVRGNRIRRYAASRRPRSIPACAGEPMLTGQPDSVAAVYPRVCGGTCGNPMIHRRITGLSPRVRGNRWIRWRSTAASRSIPACAGEPNPRRMSSYATKVYPRVCGGTCRGYGGGSALVGLSPRVRGNPPPS